MSGPLSRAAAVVGLLVMTGCASQQSLLRWSPGKVTGITTPQPPTLDVTSQPADPDAPLTAKSLPERAAAAYISALAAHETDPAKLRSLMATPISKNGDDGGTAGEFSRVLVIDVQRNGVRPADRFAQTAVEIAPTTDPETGKPDYLFADYQAASTTNASVNIGTVAITSQVSTSVSATPSFGTAAQQAAASYGVVNTNASTHNIAETTQLSVNAGPEKVTIIRTGAEGMDLAGQTLVKVGLQFPEAAMRTVHIADTDIFDEDKGAPKRPKDAKVTVTATEIVGAHNTYVCARLSYVDRLVLKGDEYRDEGQQTVMFESQPGDWKPYLVISQSEMANPMWVIMTPDAALELDTGLALERLVFDDYNAAQQFRAWLVKYHPTRIGGNALYAGDIGGVGRPVGFAHLDVVRLADTSTDTRPRTCPAK